MPDTILTRLKGGSQDAEREKAMRLSFSILVDRAPKILIYLPAQRDALQPGTSQCLVLRLKWPLKSTKLTRLCFCCVWLSVHDYCQNTHFITTVSYLFDMIYDMVYDVYDMVYYTYMIWYMIYDI